MKEQDWLQKEELQNGTVKLYLEDLLARMDDFFPNENHRFGYFVQMIGNEKARYFTPEQVNLRQFVNPEYMEFLDTYVDYIVDIHMIPANAEGGIYAVSMDNFHSSLEEILGMIPPQKNALVMAVNSNTEPKIQYPYFITDMEITEDKMYEIEGAEDVDSSLAEQYTYPSEGEYLEIYLKRTLLGDIREAEHERSLHEDDSE